MAADELPEALIQLIQSFFTTKEAARTSTLSQSWLSAWLTRPNLDFDLNDFCSDSDCDVSDSLLDFASKSVCTHELSNLKIDSFSIRNIYIFSDSQSNRCTNLIARALKLGATRLNISLSCYLFQLPNEVFASENLVSVTAKLCKLELPVVGRSSLRSLTFEFVEIKSPDVLFSVISSCPLIENLSLSYTLNSSGGGDGSFNGGMISLPNLTSLELDQSGYDALFLNALSSKFPSLKDLRLRIHVQESPEEMLISSPSLESLHFNFIRCRGCYDKIQNLKFDLPRICKLTFEATTGSVELANGWESDVSVNHHHLTATNIEFLGISVLRGMDVRIANLKRLASDGLNDVKEAGAQIFHKHDFVWRDVARLDDSTIPIDYQLRDVRFYLIWQPKQKKLKLV